MGDANGAGATTKTAPKKKSRNVDMEKLAEALPHLNEDDLLQVVQMVHDNKSEETYTKNDLESESAAYASQRECNADLEVATDGEFHVDLYTLPDNLIKMLWDFTSNRVDMAAVA